MQQTIAIGEIQKRAESIGLTLARLARAAKVHPSTAYRLLDGSSSGLQRTHVKLTMALQAREAERLAELQQRKPAGDGA